MIDHETRGLLAQARDEIRQLQRANEILGAKVEVLDLFACTLHTTAARPSQGMGEDIAWKIQKLLDDTEVEKAADELRKAS